VVGGGLMPRYQQGKDWVEIAGAQLMTMDELAQMDLSIERGVDVVKAVVQDGCFVNRKTNAEITGWRENPLALHSQQWKWLRKRIWDASFDEALDPEA
jgi:hypothetical protein